MDSVTSEREEPRRPAQTTPAGALVEDVKAASAREVLAYAAAAAACPR